ncbi:uncharacterized protein LOC142802914 [Rhipicephalus microplus]|uniref:uncharacterized protein LOC142802914 n=1 Tax=Rhipicephalus microplus TaxID=6941 RepID=UPI003F6B137C
MDSLASDDLLIEEVRRRPLLYDQRLKTYRDKQLQRDAWEQVSRVLGQSVPDNKHRWHSLRQKFLRLRKAYVKSGSGSDAAKKQWALFDNLMFLNDAIQSRSTVSSMEGGPRHLPPEVRPPNTFTPSSNSSTSAEELLQSMYMDSSEDTDRTRDNSLGQAAYVLEVDDQVAEPSSLSDNEVVEDDHQRPPGSEADSSACATARPTAPTGTRKTSSKKRNQVDIDELVVATLTENRKRLNELKYSNTDQDELFLLSMKPLLARLEDRKKEMTKITSC